MSDRTIYINGNESDAGGHDGGSRFSNERVVAIVLCVAGTLLIILGTRWLNSVDGDIQELKKSVNALAVSQAEINVRLGYFLSEHKGANNGMPPGG